MAEYISKVDMCCFVYDYAYNAPTTEQLAKTHKMMFDKIKQAKLDTPIMMASMP